MHFAQRDNNNINGQLAARDCWSADSGHPSSLLSSQSSSLNEHPNISNVEVQTPLTSRQTNIRKQETLHSNKLLFSVRENSSLLLIIFIDPLVSDDPSDVSDSHTQAGSKKAKHLHKYGTIRLLRFTAWQCSSDPGLHTLFLNEHTQYLLIIEDMMYRVQCVQT